MVQQAHQPNMENKLNRFDSAARGLATDRTPIWFMRQAGRYLPEYREVRKNHSFDAMLADSDLATEITLQPIRRFDLDAAVIFADIMTILGGLDIPFNFASGGPELEFDIRSENERAKINRTRLVSNEIKLAPFLTAIRNTRRELKTDKSVIGFAASPFTLLSYLIEGKTSKTHNRTRAFMASEPELFQNLMTSLAECTAEYLNLQIQAGASAVQIFESWGDVLGGAEYARHILPHIRRITEDVQTKAPVVFYDKGASLHIAEVRPFIAETGAVYSVDWRIDISTLTDLKIQGNLDPALLESDAKSVRAAVQKILSARESIPGHIFNLGHGISPEAKLECVEAMVETVQRQS